ncbi:RTA1 like protein-domain-containing protein [Pyrenochaeta sp. MPI-SDFR-AT-0127]|nr:RTA1 like protein-domain-containing protein [Pyrenochaeta sp. MPI-SDFR-AT-0127]
MSDPNWRDTCTYETCKLEWSYWGYRPSYTANIAFTGIVGKRWLGFTIAMVSGCALEVIGYVGRVLAYNDLFHEHPFLIQIVCLTIGPAFLAAGIYLCLSRIVTTFGPENSRIKPLSYPRIFIPCDFVSLILQAIGGGIASAKTHAGEDPEFGNNVMIAGLAVQVFTLLVFIILALDFAFNTYRRISHFGAESALDPRHAKLRGSWVFKGFLVALSFSTLCIFTRCVYRVAELSEGWSGHLMKTQKYFIGLEGAVVVAAVLALNIFHPGFCFREALDARSVQKSTRYWYGRKRSLPVEVSRVEK